MIFAPIGGNDTAPCTGVDAYQASRSDPQDSFQAFSLFLFLFSSTLWLASLFWFYAKRDHPRLRAIRPFILSVIVVLGQVFWALINLNLYSSAVPCFIVPVSLLFGMGGVAVTFYLRLVVFAVESQFARNAHFLKVAAEDDEETQISQPRRSSFINALCQLGLLLFGCASLQELSIQQISRAKQSYISIAVITCIPSILPLFVLLGSIPVYSQCNHCAVFYEVLIAFFFQGMIYFVLGSRASYVLYKAKFPDNAGVLRELVCCLVTGGLILLVTVVWMFDPANAEFNRVFAYEWLYQLLMIAYWYFYVFEQFRATQVRQQRIRAFSMVKAPSIDLDTVLNTPVLSKSFEEYCVKLYAVESMHFVQDVRNFQRYFPDKADSWRLAKAKLIFNTYVAMDGVMEINVSWTVRDKIRKRIFPTDGESVIASNKLELCFQEAVVDIRVSILEPMLVDFWEQNHDALKMVNKVEDNALRMSVENPRTSSSYSSSPLVRLKQLL